ncbi:MAG: class I tRNA ligase family protein [Acidimicrobiales bacterium]
MSATENAGAEAPYPHVESPDLPGIERRILERWKAASTFEESVQQRPADDEYVFYDGPPFANGLPHHGHLLTGYVKDVVPRYQTMKGKRVERRFGWDCHGLPAEMEAEKHLPVSGRASIIEYGIDRFNEYCRTSVLKYTQEWERTVTRQARWVDFENDYKTMDLDYMESVIWAFKQLWDKGLIYQANRVLPYSWGAETPLSNHEIRLDDATRPRQDPAVTVAFTLDPLPDDDGPMAILAWTTTPWTLPSNLALAVGPDIDYAVMLDADGAPSHPRRPGARRRAATQARNASRHRQRAPPSSAAPTTPVFDYFAHMAEESTPTGPATAPPAFVVLGDDFVDTTEGTGSSPDRPGFGEDDGACAGPMRHRDGGARRRLGSLHRRRGRVSDQNVLEANARIIKHLRSTGQLVRHDSYATTTRIAGAPTRRSSTRRCRAGTSRSPPSATRCSGQPDDQLGAVAHPRRPVRPVQRAPATGRSAATGSGVPRSRCGSATTRLPRTDVYGSLDEIEADFGVRPTSCTTPTSTSSPGRTPTTRRASRPCAARPRGARLLVPSRDRCRSWSPLPVREQGLVRRASRPTSSSSTSTGRGWFYDASCRPPSLDRPGFQSAICHGILLADDGKLSKKLRNYTEPEAIFEAGAGVAVVLHVHQHRAGRRHPDLRPGHRRRGPSVILPIWNALVLLHAVRERRRPPS